jgi:CheY-like chemotaxis protein
MNLSNIWEHPKTTAAGLLLAIVTVAEVFEQQGVTLGHIGVGTGVSLLAAVATALLGLLARDPEKSSSKSQTGTQLGIALLIGLMISMPVMQGCTQQQRLSVAQEIVNWTPVFVSTADTVNAAVMALDPATVIVLAPLTAAVNALAPELQKAAQAYLVNPNQTTLQLLQAMAAQIQQDVNATLLAAAKITNPASQAKATQQINLVATVMITLFGLVQSISTKAQVAVMESQVHVTFAEVRPYLDIPAIQIASTRVSRDLKLGRSISPNEFFAYEAQSGF